MSALILTAAFAPADQAHFDALRAGYFPAHLNHIDAHLTLFHHLPGEDETVVDHAVTTLASAHPPLSATVTGLRSLGRGVAYTLACPALAQLRAALARGFHEQLTPQDRQGWRPHVTIQNKVSPAEAASTLAALQAGFTPHVVGVRGLALWRYAGGPWSLVALRPFAERVAQDACESSAVPPDPAA